MRVIEPKRRNNLPRQTSKTAFLVVITLGVLAALAILYLSRMENDAPQNQKQPVIENPVIKKSGQLKRFSGPEFVKLYYSIALPNTQTIDEEAEITGDTKTDSRLKQLAKQRGYRLQSAPVANVLKDPGKDETIKLQPKALTDWKKLRDKARQDGLELSLVAGFRSAAQQIEIFLDRIERVGVNIDNIPSSNYDKQILGVLKTTALPGYSKHHSGYTIDIACPSDANVIFEDSICFKWLSKNNYKNAKESGWIPSYPKGTSKQGPEPEAWEYVWVGRQNLIK